METRPYGGGFTNFVGIKCGWCKVEEWQPARNGGWAMRVFRTRGWKVANKDAQHRCPTCFGRVINARRTPDNPAIPKEIGKVLKTKILEAHVRDELLGTSVLTPQGINAMPRPSDERPPEAKALDGIHPVPPMPPPAPAPLSEPPVRGKKPTPGVTMFTRRDNAARSGAACTGSRDGIEFFTVQIGDGWTWKHARDTSPTERAQWWEGRKLGPRYDTPEERRANARPPQPEKEPTMPTPPTLTVVPTEPPKDPMTSTATSADIRQPTRDERSAIHDELTKLYDTVDQRYSGNESDKTLAERLDVPRAWVSDLRTMFFGDYDRNAASEKKQLAVTEALALATAASKRLLEMASEAETIERGLAAALKKLEG